MPRAICKGAISFGLVYVPVTVYPATQSERTGFNEGALRYAGKVGTGFDAVRLNTMAG